MKPLIVCYSYTHNNLVLAKHLQKLLSCTLYEVQTVRKRNGFSILLDLMFSRTPEIKEHSLPLESYPHIILIAPVWAGKIATPMKSFLLKERDRIKNYSFISVCGGQAGQKEKIEHQLFQILRLPPSRVSELWINKLLPTEQKDTIKHTSGYRISEQDLKSFQTEINDFLMAELST